MNVFHRIQQLSCDNPPCPVSEEEKKVVRMFSDRAVKVRYCGNKELVGLLVIGQHAGIRIEATPSGKIVRSMNVVRGVVVPTATTRRLRLDNHGRLRGIKPETTVY